MAKKKTTTTVEETEEPTKDQELDYKKDIEDKSFDQVAADTPKEEVKEEVKEEPKEDETETVEFDPEQLKKEAVDQAKSEMADLLKGDTKAETKENVSHYQEFQEEFLKKNNRQPTWFEVAEDMEQQAVLKLETKQAEKVKAQEEEKTKAKEVETQNNEATNKYVKDTLDELYTTDKLPKIQNKDDTDDYGLKVQNALLKTVVDINTKRIEEGQTPKTIKEIFYEDFKAPRREVPGADAPTNMGRGGFTPDDSETIDYNRDIAGPRNSIRNIITNAFKRGQF
jgi:hypothetical protein